MMLRAKIGKWISRSRFRLYALFLTIMLLPITFFAYSVGLLLRHQAEAQAETESTKIAQVSVALLADHFRQSTSFLETIAARPSFRHAWEKKDLNLIQSHLQQASTMRPDFAFVSAYDLRGTMRGIYPYQSDLITHNFALNDWYTGVVRSWGPYLSEIYHTSSLPDSLVVAIAVPVRDDTGTPIGILMASTTIDVISGQLTDAKLENGWTVSVVDQNGQISSRLNKDSLAPAGNFRSYEPVK